MSVTKFAKNQIQVAKCIGQKDFDGAIRILEKSLSDSSRDLPALEMIALCHRWSHRDSMAIASAQKALAYEPKHFGAIRLLSELYAEQENHEAAAQFARLGIENYPSPLPAASKAIMWLLRIGATVFPRLKRINEAAQRDLADPNRDRTEWYAWARAYLTWYDSTFGIKQDPTVH